MVNGPLCALSLCCIKKAFLNLINKNLPVNKTKLLHELLQGTCSNRSRELPHPLCAGMMDAPCSTNNMLCFRFISKDTVCMEGSCCAGKQGE